MKTVTGLFDDYSDASAAVSALVLRLDPQALDLRTVLDGNATLIGDDGLHPTGEGHTRMAAAVIARLAGT